LVFPTFFLDWYFASDEHLHPLELDWAGFSDWDWASFAVVWFRFSCLCNAAAIEQGLLSFIICSASSPPSAAVMVRIQHSNIYQQLSLQ
jgi:hypothetical protein